MGTPPSRSPCSTSSCAESCQVRTGEPGRPTGARAARAGRRTWLAACPIGTDPWTRGQHVRRGMDSGVVVNSDADLAGVRQIVVPDLALPPWTTTSRCRAPAGSSERNRSSASNASAAMEVVLEDLRDGPALEHGASQGMGLELFRRADAQQVAQQARVVEIQLRLFHQSLAHVGAPGAQPQEG